MFSLEGSIIIIVVVLWKKAVAVIQMLGKLPNKNVILFFYFHEFLSADLKSICGT